LRERAVALSAARSDRVRGYFATIPLTRLAPEALTTLSRKGRG